MGVKSKLHQLRKLFSYISKGEFALFLYEFSGYFPSWLFKYNAGVVMSGSSPRITVRKYKNYYFSFASKRDKYDMVNISALSESQIDSRFDSGEECHIARNHAQGNKVVNIIWIHKGPCFIKGFWLPLEIEDNAYYLYGGYTLTEERMKGIFSTALKNIYDNLTARGADKIYSLIELWNENSYNYHIRLNFKPLYKVIFLSVAAIKFLYIKNLAERKREIRVSLTIPRDYHVI